MREVEGDQEEAESWLPRESRHLRSKDKQQY